MELIPAIDLLGGRCVRLVHGDFAAETVYDVEPAALYDRYAALGARWLHVVDLDGARDGTQAHLPVIAALAARGPLRLQVGGGLRDRAALERTLAAGAARVVVGSLAVTDPDLVCGLLRRFGGEAVVLALDVRLEADGTPRIATHGWQAQSQLALWDAVARFRGSGLQHVLCTDVGRDGALGGPNCALYVDAVRHYPGIEWQASGGVRDAGDLWALANGGVAAAVSGRALLEGRLGAEELKPFLPGA
ncbi:MAG: 1-(5-phosphoribosyl)-5-[(5-phosphoribosylamino)methylideneamino] imidazole-4-carboxamide isomerase [Proteobacteria bacterium]|nr:1-(5-phosphoribosyl)-5-[(5-phosphoribosylamino)methylideneamino] imidazole-4-carboxamide isomerase [Pseudomonadota bacterium]